jgi:hypothetical protein
MSSTGEPGRRRRRAIAAITTAGTRTSSHVACAATPDELEPPEPPAAPAPPPAPAAGTGAGAGTGGVNDCVRVFVEVRTDACVTTVACACVELAVLPAARDTPRLNEETTIDAA